MASFGCAPTSQALPTQLAKRSHQFRLLHNPFAIHRNDPIAFGVAVVLEDKRVAPLACRQAVLRNLAADVNIEFLVQIMHNGCLCHGGSSFAWALRLGGRTPTIV